MFLNESKFAFIFEQIDRQKKQIGVLNSSIGKNKSVISQNKFVVEIIDLFSELKIPPADETGVMNYHKDRYPARDTHRNHTQYGNPNPIGEPDVLHTL